MSQGETERLAFQEMMAAILVNGVKTVIVWMETGTPRDSLPFK